jgi:heme-degrading monooxygenase HmoA
MIARVWHGWTSRRNAEAYERHFHTTVLGELNRLDGFEGAYLLRRQDGEEVEFIAITHFESIEAVRSFAGADYSVAVIADEAKRVLSRYDHRAEHYTVVVRPEAGEPTVRQ